MCVLLLFIAYQPVKYSSLFNCFTNSAAPRPSFLLSSSNSLALAGLTLCPSSDPWHAVVPLLLSSVFSWGMVWHSTVCPWVPYTSPLWLPDSLVSVSRESGRLRAWPLLWCSCCFFCYSVAAIRVSLNSTRVVYHIVKPLSSGPFQIPLQKWPSSWNIVLGGCRCGGTLTRFRGRSHISVIPPAPERVN